MQSPEERPLSTYHEKMLEANREARLSVIGLGVIFVAWFVGGFGLAAFDISLAGLPLWVIGGTILPWLVSVGIAILFAYKLFRNFDLDDEEGQAHHE